MTTRQHSDKIRRNTITWRNTKNETKRNSPKKNSSNFQPLPMPRTSRTSIAVASTWRSIQLSFSPAVSPPFSSATPASPGSFHCMLLLGYPSDSSPAVYLFVPALQFQHHRIREHRLPLLPLLGDPSGSHILAGCISTIPSCNSSLAGELPFPLPSSPSQARPRAEPPLSLLSPPLSSLS